MRRSGLQKRSPRSRGSRERYRIGRGEGSGGAGIQRRSIPQHATHAHRWPRRVNPTICAAQSARQDRDEIGVADRRQIDTSRHGPTAGRRARLRHQDVPRHPSEQAMIRLRGRRHRPLRNDGRAARRDPPRRSAGHCDGRHGHAVNMPRLSTARSATRWLGWALEGDSRLSEEPATRRGARESRFDIRGRRNGEVKPGLRTIASSRRGKRAWVHLRLCRYQANMRDEAAAAAGQRRDDLILEKMLASARRRKPE